MEKHVSAETPVRRFGLRRATKRILAVAALFSASAGTTFAVEYWATGVTAESGWKDQLQAGNYCWAYSDANALSWWQEQLAKKYVLPDDAIIDEEKLAKWFTSNYPNAGRVCKEGIVDFFDTFYPDLFYNEYNTDWAYTNYTFYYEYQRVSEEAKAKIYDYIYTEFSKGAVGILTSGSASSSAASHAVTVWGAEFDEDNKATKLYITDSTYLSQEVETGLLEYIVKDIEGEALSLYHTYTEEGDGYVSTGMLSLTIYALDFLKVNDEYLVDSSGNAIFTLIPELSAFGAFAGTLALALGVLRRRRRR